MNDWLAYQTLVKDAFRKRTGVSGEIIRTRTLRQCFILALSPDDAADKAATEYVNGLRHAERMSYYKRQDESR